MWRPPPYWLPGSLLFVTHLAREMAAVALSCSVGICSACDERMVNGLYYGCQTRTRLGKTCQSWASQVPHKHELLQSEAHNYCRNPEGESYIWCFTTDPTMRFDTCEPLGVTQQYIQPESTFSVEYYSSGASPYKSLRFFEGATEMSLCGSSDLTLSLGVELPADPRGAFVEIPESLFEDGDSQKLVWSGFKLSFGQTGSLLACICDFEFAGAYTIHPNGSCTDVSDYNVHGGLLRIGGPIPSEGLAPLSYTASKPFSLEVSGLQLRKGDRVDIARDTGSSSCFLRSLGRTLSVARGFGGQISTSYQLAAAWLEQAFNMEATVTFKSIETKGPYDLASTEPITVSSIDEYVICWTGEETDGHAVGRIGKFNTTGFDASTRHVATYAPSSSGANTTLFSLYVRYAGSQLNYDSVFFTLREASASRCEGVELAQSSQVSSFTSSKNSEVVRGSGLLLRPTAVGKLTTGTPLHLCINNRKETVFAGFAIVEEFGLFETWQVSGEGTPQGVPLSTHEVILEPFSPLGLHWLQSDTTGFISGAEDFYTAGEFTKTISFAVFEDGVVIYSWTYEDVAPVHVATIKRSGWRALTMDITFDRCILYAAEGGKRPAINKFDASDPRKLASVSPLATSSVSLQSPCCLVTVYEDEEKQSNPSVVFLDKGLGMFVWLNPSLGLVESRDNWSGLRRPLQYPCSLACIPRGTVTSSHSSDEPESKQRGVYDCFIADRDADRVVQIELDAVKQGTVLVREFASVGTAGDRLSRPLNVVAFNYNGETLLFVVQEGRQSIDLLVPKNDGTTDYYSTMEEQSVGQGIPSLPAVVEVGEKGSGLDFARMVLYRTSLTSVAMQTLSLDATAVAQPFTYGHADWYTVGDEDILEPIMAGRTSVGAFKSFNLNPNVSNFAYVSTIADVAETKGTLTLRIAPFTDSTLEISVIGKGVVNEVTSTFSINIACKNGHFMKQGMCAKCPVGTYNSLLLVKQSPTERWGSCKPCSNLTSTVSEGSTSEEQCICAKGYYLDETQPDKGCTPCPPGTWKDIVSDTGCVGIECPSNSSSSVTGAKSSEDRRCSCNAGYVYDKDLDSCILSTAGRYSPGGYKATGFPCPYNTTTMPDPSSPLTSLQDCFCTAGYEPADSAKLADSSTVEYDFREWLRSNPEYSGIADSQVCVPCGRTRYKETVSAEACLPCPTSSYSSSYAPKARKDCNLCLPGFYETAYEGIPCGQCTLGSFCVGSEPEIPSLKPYAGLKQSCPLNADTVESNEKNTHPFSCLYVERTYLDLCTHASWVEGKVAFCIFAVLTSLSAFKVTPLGVETLCLLKGDLYCCYLHCLFRRCQPGYEPVSVELSEGALSCAAVPKGSFKDTHSNTSAEECPWGAESESAGANSMLLCVCRPGEYKNLETSQCTVSASPSGQPLRSQPCPMGYYCPGGHSAETEEDQPQVACPPQMTTTSERATSSADCVCEKGFYRPTSSATEEYKSCVLCPVNTYNDTIGNSYCRACNDNSGTGSVGATSASQCLCKEGYYFSDQLKQCTACRDPYKYCPGGSVACTDEPSCVAGFMPAPPVPCPQNTRITAGFDTPSSQNDCLCDRGFAFRGYDEDGNKTCEPCPSGSYKSSVYDSNCNGLCGSHSTSFPGMQQQDQCFCESGTYYAEGGCHACPVGAVCLGGLTKEAQERVLADATTAVVSTADHIKPFPTAGYFLHMINEQLESPDDWFFIKCPVVSACLENGECSETMDNYLCSECKEGFTSTFEPGEVCTKCPSMGLNIALCTGYYVGLLLFNIGMAYMNVAAGFNRRSIHSIVIKIASNFLTCMSVISMVDFELIELPNWFYQVQTNMLAQISSSEKTHWVAVDCFLREGLQLSYSDSFFFTMLFYALLPIVLPIIATLIMFLIVDRAKHYYRHSTQRKLGVLQQTIRFDMMALAEQLRDKLEEDRLFMMFRYVPLPGESMWRRIYKFFEDMTPIYVTVLFFIYTSTTRRMLSLLECTSINFGDVHGSVSFLTAVMNVQCTVHPSKEYFTFFLLGITGLVFWSIGVPLGAFLVLYVNRKNLNSRENRLKYGFLHNGFVSKYWYWETVVFARKLCVLIVSSVVLVSNSSASAATITVSTAIAIAFNVLHLRCQPFDKRSYLTLDRLENHSMAVWTMASCTMSLMLGAEFQGMVNVVLLAIAILPVLSFALEVAVSLILAYFDNVRATKSFFWVPVLGRVFRFFAYLSERRRAREPVVVFDEVDQSIQLVAAKRVGRLSRLFRVRNKSINFEERSYFLKVMAEALGLAVVHLRLDVIPGSFLEFALRLGLAFSKIEEDNQNTKASLQALAGGDLSKLLDWTQQEEAKKEQRRGIARTKSVTAVRMHDYYSELEKKLDANEHEKSSLSSSEEEEKRERNRDLEGGESQSEESESESDNGDTERRLLSKDCSQRLLELGKLVSRMTEEEQAETTYLFDENLLNCGIVLSELYLSLLKLQLKSPQAIASQFEAFRDKKGIVTEERASQLRMKNRKLKIFRDSATCVLNNPPEDIKEILPTPEEAESVKQQLEAITKKNRFLTQQLESLRSSPGDFQAGTDEYLQWIDAAERQEGDTFEEIQRIDKLLEQKSTEEAYGFQEGGILASSGSDLSDKDDSIEKPPKKLLGQPVKVVAANAEDWMEG
ncbi:uncharacterized protein LOC34621266 [Cyclospora cayetanensis]|uniref:Uncharacterized protein LOC34621266 n=1 Tax=Cyclospora cayetanensis TaxID=88456 RepID=A0A6P6RQP5_9EIME|nr:uncharacterized protein LOC34621266 [Cyclospora cayetanensis]